TSTFQSTSTIPSSTTQQPTTGEDIRIVHREAAEYK
ncbi:unnamed protein product, partial [Didymodactylos carnosus]